MVSAREKLLLLGGGGEAARRQLPPLRAHHRLLPLTPRVHWPNRAIFSNRLRKIYRLDRVTVQDVLSQNFPLYQVIYTECGCFLTTCIDVEHLFIYFYLFMFIEKIVS